MIAEAALVVAMGGYPVDPQARAAFPAFLLTCGEGSTTWPYPDSKGNITIGVGNMLPDYPSFAALDWRDANGNPANANAVQTAWAVMARAAAYVRAQGSSKWPGGGSYQGLTSIRATQASIARLIDLRIDSFEATLRGSWEGWDDAPGPAQEALMRIAWAVGPAHLDVRWPKLHAAWVARDWETCAVESRIPELDAVEPAANDAEAELFRSAVEWQAPQS